MPLMNRLYRTSQIFHGLGLGWLGRIVQLVIRVLFQASIPGTATIAPNVFFHHSGLGVVINKYSVIERDCEIGVHVVLGGKSPLPGAPHLEPDVIVHAGAKVIGPILIGRGSVIAANAVVLSDVPPYTLVAECPPSLSGQA